MTVKVAYIESERGWGQRVDEIKEFPSMEEARGAVTAFNEQNNEPVTPDWYMFAEIVEE